MWITILRRTHSTFLSLLLAETELFSLSHTHTRTHALISYFCALDDVDISIRLYCRETGSDREQNIQSTSSKMKIINAINSSIVSVAFFHPRDPVSLLSCDSLTTIFIRFCSIRPFLVILRNHDATHFAASTKWLFNKRSSLNEMNF